MRTAGEMVSTTRAAPRRPAARDPQKRPRESPRVRRVRARPQRRRRLAVRRRRIASPANFPGNLFAKLSALRFLNQGGFAAKVGEADE